MFGVRAASCDDERGGADVVSTTAHPSANRRDKTNSEAADRLLLFRVIFVKLPGHVEPFVLMVLACAVQQHPNRYWKRMLQYILAARPVCSLK
jgi:hypothetical protein